MQGVKSHAFVELNSVIALLDYIDVEITGIDKFAQILVRTGATILRERAVAWAQLADALSQREAAKLANLTHSVG